MPPIHIYCILNIYSIFIQRKIKWIVCWYKSIHANTLLNMKTMFSFFCLTYLNIIRRYKFATSLIKDAQTKSIWKNIQNIQLFRSESISLNISRRVHSHFLWTTYYLPMWLIINSPVSHFHTTLDWTLTLILHLYLNF